MINVWLIILSLQNILLWLFRFQRFIVCIETGRLFFLFFWFFLQLFFIFFDIACMALYHDFRGFETAEFLLLLLARNAGASAAARIANKAVFLICLNIEGLSFGCGFVCKGELMYVRKRKTGKNLTTGKFIVYCFFLFFFTKLEEMNKLFFFCKLIVFCVWSN